MQELATSPLMPLTSQKEPTSGAGVSPTTSQLQIFADEHFALIETLWPAKQNPLQSGEVDFWNAIAQSDHGLFEDSDVLDQNDSHLESRWDFNELCRSRLIKYCADAINGNRGNTLLPIFPNLDEFPSNHTLDMCIDTYFRRFHTFMPFIHQPTFSARRTSTSFLLALCLIGSVTLGSQDALHFAKTYLPYAIKDCRRNFPLEMTPNNASHLVTALGSSLILLTTATMIPRMIDDEQVLLLHTEAILIARKHGFVSTRHLNRSQLADSSLQCASWEKWARSESAKRLLVYLIMVDTWCAHLLSTLPILHPGDTSFFLPCESILFDAPTEAEWNRMIQQEGSRTSSFVSFSGMTNKLPGSMRSEYGFYGLFSAIWNKIHQANHDLLRDGQRTSEHGPVYPALRYAEDSEARVISPLLGEVYQNYFRGTRHINPNCLTSYNHLCLLLTANLSTLGLAAGRSGAECAKAALCDISSWSYSAAARRACLHAAQIYQHMSQKRTSDGTMFHSETAIFDAALVLALYLYLAPHTTTSGSVERANDYELLDEVDWTSVGSEGLAGFQNDSLSDGSQICAARRFVRHGGHVRFSGVHLRPGYGSARRVLLDYVHLLEDVGKWRSELYCSILRIMSDNLLCTWRRESK
ncbi:hypothetical protein EDD37DRAFT_695160 [Exophiala viscosa]|uniref:uncharacterized protein n=1 Tax=Exophiala viscosa TaxID=2486360 RepID=UPI002196F49B|nr:hypothetical protein EDD37DRAFT_695160 [Exophiala viscosa]